MNWNAIPLENAINCTPLNTQSEIPSTNEHENIRCRTPLYNSSNLTLDSDSDFAFSLGTQNIDTTENHENDIEVLASDKNVQFLVEDEMHNKTKGYLKGISLSQKQLSTKETKNV